MSGNDPTINDDVMNVSNSKISNELYSGSKESVPCSVGQQAKAAQLVQMQEEEADTDLESDPKMITEFGP